MDPDINNILTSQDYICIVMISLSIIGILYILLTIFTKRKVFDGHLFINYAILLITVFFQVISFMLIIIRTELCTVQAFTLISSDSCQLIWNLILVLEIYHFICFNDNIQKKNWKFQIVIGLFLPLIITLSAYFLKIFQKKEGQRRWCWVDIDDTNQTNLKAFIFAGIVILIEIFMIFLNLYILYSAKKLYFENIDIKKRNILMKYYKIFLFTYATILSNIIYMVSRILLIFKISWDPLNRFQMIFFCSGGVFHFLIFYFSYKNTKEEIIEESVEGLI